MTDDDEPVETLICLVCGQRIVLAASQDGSTISLPDAVQFRREHADCLRRVEERDRG